MKDTFARPHAAGYLNDFINKINESKDVLILSGARQIGKSTLLDHLTRGRPRLFLNLEQKRDLADKINRCEEFSDFESLLADEFNFNPARQILIIDEAQCAPQLGLFVRFMKEEWKSATVILTGSLIAEMNVRNSRAPVGRETHLEMWPMSFKEFLLAHKKKSLFKALQQYNYFDAKALFEKVLKKEPSAANYGLAVIYSRTDNPFHNLDSAYSKIQVSEASYAALKEKTKVKYKAYQFDYLAIVTLRASISTVFFKQALAQPTESGMDTYQRKHPWAQERFIAIHLRDSIGFKVAADKSTSVAYNNFLKTYPESEFASRAQKEFYRLQYLEL